MPKTPSSCSSGVRDVRPPCAPFPVTSSGLPPTIDLFAAATAKRVDARLIHVGHRGAALSSLFGEQTGSCLQQKQTIATCLLADEFMYGALSVVAQETGFLALLALPRALQGRTRRTSQGGNFHRLSLQ